MPHTLLAAALNFFGPLVPESAQTCAAGWASAIIVLNNIIKFALSAGIIIAVLMIAYAGFLWVTNPINAENRTKARSVLMNAGIGLLIALGAWLIVNTLLGALSGGSANISSFTGFISGGETCITAKNQTQGPGGGGLTTTPPAGNGNGGYTYDPGIQAQTGAESAKLSALLSCMSGKLPAGVGRISSISDSAITSGQKTFAQCAASGCAHSANSCHYGGRTCVGQSYAVDFGDGDPDHPDNLAALKAAAQACGADYTTANEDGRQTHFHASVGASCGCN